MASSGNSKFLSLDYFRSFIKFGVVGATGVVVNEGLLLAFLSMGVYLLYASTAAIEVSILSNFIMNDLWTFKDRRSGHFAVRLVKFNLLMLAGLVVNAAVLDVGTGYFGIHAAIANLVGIGAAFFLRYALSVKYAWMRVENVETGGGARFRASGKSNYSGRVSGRRQAERGSAQDFLSAATRSERTFLASPKTIHVLGR